MNAATVVNMAHITGTDIRVAATAGALELSKCLLVFKYEECSPTTMASSTTIPKAIISPNNEIMLIDCPEANITPNVAKKAIGMHWGCFILTDEPVTEPPKLLKDASVERKSERRLQ